MKWKYLLTVKEFSVIWDCSVWIVSRCIIWYVTNSAISLRINDHSVQLVDLW